VRRRRRAGPDFLQAPFSGTYSNNANLERCWAFHQRLVHLISKPARSSEGRPIKGNISQPTGEPDITRMALRISQRFVPSEQR
jgi:hypothetical protein